MTAKPWISTSPLNEYNNNGPGHQLPIMNNQTHAEDCKLLGPIPDMNKEGEPETGNYYFVIPIGTSFLVPPSHLQELIKTRKAAGPVYQRYVYNQHNPNQKWNYFCIGLVVGSLSCAIIKIISSL